LIIKPVEFFFLAQEFLLFIVIEFDIDYTINPFVGKYFIIYFYYVPTQGTKKSAANMNNIISKILPITYKKT